MPSSINRLKMLRSKTLTRLMQERIILVRHSSRHLMIIAIKPNNNRMMNCLKSWSVYRPKSAMDLVRWKIALNDAEGIRWIQRRRSRRSCDHLLQTMTKQVVSARTYLVASWERSLIDLILLKWLLRILTMIINSIHKQMRTLKLQSIETSSKGKHRVSFISTLMMP